MGRTLILAGAIIAGIIAGRVMPPALAQTAGTMRGTAGRDPLAALEEDHRVILLLLDQLAASPDTAMFARSRDLLRLKRRLAAHAMAEEDVVYPSLSDKASIKVDAMHLYNDHAEMKIHLFALEGMGKDDFRWKERLLELRELIQRHVRQEEDFEFPKLRAALNEGDIARLSGLISREKALVL